MNHEHPETDPPVARVQPRRVSLTWLIPLFAAAVIAAVLIFDLSKGTGPTVSIRFDDAAGLKQGDSIVHRGLAVGVVRGLRLDDTMSGVVATCELAPHASALAVEGTEFWIVRPELSLDRVAGLDTLLGPQYIAVRPGTIDGPRQTDFVGLESPPALAAPADGSLSITLISDRLGSLTPGSPVLYREIRVGSVRSAHITPDATGVRIEADIEPRFAPLVRTNTRFWRSGGVGVDFGLFKGLSVRADSLTSAMSSAVSLATPNRPDPPPEPGTTFDLADTPDDDWLGWSPEIELGPGG